MDKYIDADQIIDYARDGMCGDCYSETADDCRRRCPQNKLVEYVNSLNAADVVTVVHGRWQGIADGYWNGEPVYDIWLCSACEFDTGMDEQPDWKYCPNCGCKMDLEVETDEAD